jgi:uncharacterized integral membrane protein
MIYIEIISWIICVLIVTLIGHNRKIGWKKSLILSLLLSPIIGYLIVITYPTLKDIEYRKKIDKCIDKVMKNS